MVYTVCASAVISPLKLWLDSYAKTRLKMWHTFKHFIHMQYFLLPTNFVIVFVHWVSTGVLHEPWQCSLFWDYIPESKFCFASIHAAFPVHIQSYQYRSCSTVNNVTTRSRYSSQWGATKNSAVALSSRNNMMSIYTRGVRGRMKAKQRWFKVTRELCHEWFHHFRHHVHDSHWTGEFAVVIWRLHCFTVSLRDDVRGESGPR